MATIVFIISSTGSPRVFKRIDEFVEQGYEVEVYVFQRETSNPHISTSSSYNVHIMGVISHRHYWKRFLIMCRELKKVFRKYRTENVCYYYFMLDIAVVALFLNRKKKYMYEESDLVHTYISNRFLKWFLEKWDKYIIRSSVQTILTSEGFAQYHFGNTMPPNVSIIPNKLNKKVEKLAILPKEKLDLQNLKIGFVGVPRYNTIANFGAVLVSAFPQHEFHIFGNIQPIVEKKFEPLKSFANVFFHGAFCNPDDLPEIYSKIDMVLSTYDIQEENVKFAEPNKLYEAMFFETPIIVSKDTFLAERVRQLNVGYAVNPLDKEDIINLIQNLTLESLDDKISSCRNKNRAELVNNNTLFFHKIKQLI